MKSNIEYDSREIFGRIGMLRIAILAIILLSMFACSTQEILTDQMVSEAAVDPDMYKKEPFVFVTHEQKPTFQGGDANKFTAYVKEHLRYPQAAKDSSIQGLVYVLFVISAQGKMGGVKVLRGLHPLLDAEAVRVINSSPDWEPGTYDREPTETTYQFPVRFILPSTKDEAE